MTEEFAGRCSPATRNGVRPESVKTLRSGRIPDFRRAD
jgi:hypothetical protein